MPHWWSQAWMEDVEGCIGQTILVLKIATRVPPSCYSYPLMPSALHACWWCERPGGGSVCIHPDGSWVWHVWLLPKKHIYSKHCQTGLKKEAISIQIQPFCQMQVWSSRTSWKTWHRFHLCHWVAAAGWNVSPRKHVVSGLFVLASHLMFKSKKMLFDVLGRVIKPWRFCIYIYNAI